MAFTRIFSRKRRPHHRRNVSARKMRPIEGLEDRRMFAVDVPFSFAWVDSGTSQSGGTPSVTYSHNTSGEDISVELEGTGKYRVKFEGLADELSDGGNVQLTPYGNNGVCNIQAWVEDGEDVSAYVRCYDADGNAQNNRFDIAIIGADNNADMSYAWSQQPTGDFTAASYYAHNDAGDVEIDHLGVGRYAVTFEGQGGIGGHVQVTGYGSTPINVAVENWQSSGADLIAHVRVVDLDGTPTNGRFSIAMVADDGDSPGIGYAWASDADASEFPVSSTYSQNPSGDAIQKERISEGVYRVTFSGLNYLEQFGGHVMVTPYGSPNRIANVGGWTSGSDTITATVETYDLAGNVADANFTILATPTPQPVPQPGPFSYAWVDAPSIAESTPSETYSYNATGADIEVTRNGVGRYTVLFEDVNPSVADGGNVQITPYGSTGTCSIVNWGTPNNDLRANVHCFDANGALADSRFNIAAINDSNNAEIAYAWMGNTAGASYTSDDTWAFNPEGDIHFTRTGIGVYRAVFEGLGNEEFGGHIQVTPYGSSAASARVQSWTTNGDDLIVNLRTADASGNPVDSQLSVAVIPPVEKPDVGYAWTSTVVDEADLDASLYGYNPNGGDIEKQRTGPGRYRVTFHGINNFDDFGGHVMVSPYGSTFAASIVSWASGGPEGDMIANINTYDAAGNLVDGRFNIAVVGEQPLPGDFNADGVVDGEDLADLCEGIHADDLDYDLNQDGVVDKGDMDQLVHEVLNTHYGDANLDGAFDTADLVQIFSAGKYETGADAVWAEGDFNCDGIVDSSDLVVALADGGYVG